MSRILILDDEEPVRFALRYVLEEAGHQVDEADNGASGESMLGQNSYDLLITDILMPGQDGIETIVHLMHSHPHLPIIAISGGGRTDSREYLHLAAGFEIFATLPKPVHPQELLALVQKAVPPPSGSTP